MQSPSPRFLLAWLLSIPASYVVSGFFSNFYSTYFEIILLVLLIHCSAGIFFYYILGKAQNQFRSQPFDFGITIALFIVLSVFVVTMFSMAKQFPSLFDAAFFQLEKDQLIYFAVLIFLALPAFAWILSFARKRGLNQTGFFNFIDENLPGLMLAASFFSVYFIFASIFNQPSFDVDDIFFDTDTNLWRWRFATEDYRDYYWRSVHPFVLIIIRPLVSLIAFFLKGDTLHATFVLIALTGAFCVFLIWYFIKQVTGNSLYAMLTASLFGASASQLVFSSLIETYIFLAAAALIFLVLLFKDKPLFALVIMGLISFGITVSNFGQTLIAHLLVKRDIKQWIKYGLIVAALVVPLTLLNNFVYPNSQPYFFDISSYGGESHNSFPPTIQRGSYLARVMFLHSFVAPQPLILNEEIPFLKVWMFRASIKKDPMRVAEYENLFGTSVMLTWVVLMLLGGMLFLKNIRKQDNRFFYTLILILLFNFSLHMYYGKDVFLYSTNWTYAILIFLALAWKELANKKWFQITLLVFLALLLANNSHLILTMLSTSALHIK